MALVAQAQESPHGNYTATTDACAACHRTHVAPSPPLLYAADQGNLFCLTCHDGSNPAAPVISTHANSGFSGGVEAPFELECLQCHEPHGSSNLYNIRESIIVSPTLGSMSGPAVFTAVTGANSYDDGSSPWASRICVTCHNNPDNPGYPVTRHTGGPNHLGGANYAGQDCVTCHPHDADDNPATLDGFMPVGGCTGCHSVGQDNGDGIPAGGRRAITGEFEDASHHVQGQVQDGDCLTCHEMTTHMDGYVELRNVDTSTIYRETNSGDFRPETISAANSKTLAPFCLSCHDSDGAGGDTTPFSSEDRIVPSIDNAAWSLSAHDTGGTYNSGYGCLGDGTTSGCHASAHGSVNEKILADASVVQSIDRFCYNCHTEGMVQNDAVSGSGLADDIEQAFGFGSANRHDLDSSFTVGGNSYTLQCTSCHNPHAVTGRYWEADQGRTPVTRPDFSDPVNNPRAMGTTPWGDEAGEKMDDYGGTYRTPTNDPFSGAELPNYVTFCNDCHEPMPDPSVEAGAHGQLQFDADPHGLNSANSPNGGGACPDWYSCGEAAGWDGDDCISDEATCWPVITRGKGDQLFSRNPFNHEQRISGVNFALSCTDCHEAHGSSVRSLVRTNPNSGTGTTIWNTMCNNCHYYYSDWHAGMSCGSASCHVSDGSDRMANTGTDTLHRMGSRYGSGATRTFNPDLVLDLRFENNLNDSGTWRLHSQWYSGAAGSFTTGRFGQAIVLNGDQLVQVGTRDAYWSTDEGQHGTWKYTEMKYNTTLEAWVYPTDDSGSEYSIFTKHVGYSQGGYAFTLKNIEGTLRAAFNAQIDNNGFTQGGAGGVRGAYSAVAIPLNTWTHVAATFDTSGPDRNPSDPTVGRIRIYVNGEDVTTGDSSGDNRQPGAGETSIFAYTENSPWNEGICYNGAWCASEFSVGGFTWQNGFVGRIDEAKVWNITEDATYFSAYDPLAGPYISSVEGVIGSDQLWVTFSEGVYANMGGLGDLQPTDFNLTDSDNGRSVISVAHTAGDNTAILTLNLPLDGSDDILIDTVAAASNAIYDEYDNIAATTPITVTGSGMCPTGQTTLQLNEPVTSTYVMDDQQLLVGAVNGVGPLTGNEFSGDGVNNYLDFENNNTCLQASTSLALTARIRPIGIPGDGSDYIRRVLARDSGGGNYQMSVWRNNGWPNYNAPVTATSIALWVRPVDNHGGTDWKPVLTDYDACPIVNDHWYQVQAVWDSAKPGPPITWFVPADIYIDDQGTDGAGAGEDWTGNANCTNAVQSYNADNQKLFTGDEIRTDTGDFVIGANVNNHANNVFDGMIDWISIDIPASQSLLLSSDEPAKPAAPVYLPLIMKNTGHEPEPSTSEQPTPSTIYLPVITKEATPEPNM